MIGWIMGQGWQGVREVLAVSGWRLGEPKETGNCIPSQSSGLRSPFEFYLPATCHLGLPPATRNEWSLLS